MARPKVENRKVVTTMRLDKALLKKLTSHSKKEGRSRSNLVEHILQTALAERERSDVLG